MVNVPFFRRRSRARCILDIPFSEYDPITYLPPFINIGAKSITPLVTLPQVRDHLIVLSSFHDLRTSAGEDAYPRSCESSAAEYERWAQEILPAQMVNEEDELPLPPLGVLMCWHAHMLNPRVFDRACDGAYAALRGKLFPLRRIAEALRDGSLPADLPPTDTEEDEVVHTTEWGSSDIAAAVQRQGKFVADMARIQWLEPDMEALPLLRGIVRYHAWLDLMHSTQGKHFLVPTLDIDLAWHTHQLQCKVYKKDVEEVLEMFLDHNDDAGEGKLGNGLELTEKLWKERFGYDYTY